MKKTITALLIAVCLTGLFISGAAAATTELTIEKYDAAGTLLNSTTVDYQWMEENLPIVGNGITSYYLQGPVFEGDSWDPTESVNVKTKNMGALRGTAVRDLCNLVGGADHGDTVTIIAEDGYKRSFPQKYMYTPAERMGTVFIAWFNAEEGYVPDYYTGMRLMFSGDTSVNPWGIHVFGNSDEKETMDEADWYFYSGKYPTTTGLSVQTVKTIQIRSPKPEPAPAATPGFGILLTLGAVSAGLCLCLRRI